MRLDIRTGLVMALWAFTVTATASSPAELFLWKKDPYLYGACGHCADFFSIRENDSPADITEFSLYTQSGYYYIDLNGPAGTTVTLYGKQKHSPDRGFLIVRKRDEAPIAVADLESFPPNRWVEVAAENSSSGAYSVWYQPYKGFKNNLESVRWGQWWTQLPLANEKESGPDEPDNDPSPLSGPGPDTHPRVTGRCSCGTLPGQRKTHSR